MFKVMLIGHKFRLYPNVKEQSILRLWIGHQRFIYNAKTQEQDYWFKFYKHSLSLTGSSYYPDQSYSQFRNDELTPWLKSKPVENMLDIKGINLSDVQRSMNQETPTTSSSFSGG